MQTFGKSLLAFVAFWILPGCTVICAARTAIQADTRAPSLQQFARMDRETFDRSLRQLRQALEQPRPNATADRAMLSAIAGKLRQGNESAPDYWPATLHFVQFASSQLAPKAPPAGQRPRALGDILSVGIMRGIREEGKTMLFDKGPLGNGTFINCRIIFTQGPVEMQNVVFRNCAFEFPATQPSAYLQKVCRLLLASGIDSVAIPSLR